MIEHGSWGAQETCETKHNGWTGYWKKALYISTL